MSSPKIKRISALVFAWQLESVLKGSFAPFKSLGNAEDIINAVRDALLGKLDGLTALARALASSGYNDATQDHRHAAFSFHWSFIEIITPNDYTHFEILREFDGDYRVSIDFGETGSRERAKLVKKAFEDAEIVGTTRYREKLVEAKSK